MKVITKLRHVLLTAILATSFSLSYSQDVKQITITVQSIDYENSKFTALREIIKKNLKVKSVKPSFSEGVATLTVSYSGDASELWDEVPKTSKQFFKLESIDDETISLINIPDKDKNISPAANNKNITQPIKKSNCFDCEYFPLCEYDVTISYGGKIYRGLRQDDNSVKYYYCENGVLTKKWETIETVVKGDAFNGFYDDEVKKAHTMIILKSNSPIGSVWTQKDAGFEFKFKIVEKGITMSHEGQVYKEVLKVRVVKQVDAEMKAKAELLQGLVNIKEEAYYHYYAKNSGHVKSDDIYDELVASGEIKPIAANATNSFFGNLLKGESEMREEIKKKNAEADAEARKIYLEKESRKVSNNAHAQLKGALDNNLFGLWKRQFVTANGDKITIQIRFNNDGTLDWHNDYSGHASSGYLVAKYDYKIDSTTLYKTPNYEWTMKKYPGCSPTLFELQKDTITKSTENLNGMPILLINDNKYIFVEPNK